MFIVPLSQLPTVVPITDQIRNDASTMSKPNVPFADLLKDAFDTMQQTKAIAKQDNVALAVGNVDNLAQIQINSAKAATAQEFTVGLVSRAITAYKEVLNMQI